MTGTRTEGNVIHHDFAAKPRLLAIPLGTAKCAVLYRDAEVVLTRTEIRIGGEAWVTHGLYPAPQSHD